MTLKILNSASSLMIKVMLKKTFVPFLRKIIENPKFLDEAVLEYEKRQGMIEMYHTEGIRKINFIFIGIINQFSIIPLVPNGYTGRGIAGLLAKV